MKLKTSFFNLTAFKKNLLRFSPIWALYTVFLLVAFFGSTGQDSVYVARDAVYMIRGMAPVNLIYGGLCAMFLFGDLFNSRLCNALHAFPVRREGWLLTGIAAGILDGLSLTTLKGALMARGTREIARLIRAMGGNELSAYGLCHLGDYEATVFSKFSHNRAYGEALVRGEKFPKLAEGHYTAKAIVEIAKKYGVDMPICRCVYGIIYEGLDVDSALTELF